MWVGFAWVIFSQTGHFLKVAQRGSLLLGLTFPSLIPVPSFFFSHVYLCDVYLYVWAHPSEYTYTCGLVSVWRPKRGVFLGCPPAYMLEKGLSLEPITHLTNLASLTIELALGIPCFDLPSSGRCKQTGSLLGNYIICVELLLSHLSAKWFSPLSHLSHSFPTFRVPTYVSKSCS